ncbi:MAG: hypothetical protein V3V41_04155 [Candidatus Heimdallarchaeota archaeon]
MSLYETIWKNEKNRTLLITSIIAITCLIISILFSIIDQRIAPNWIKGLYFNLNEDPEYKVGLVIIELLLLSGFYFFLLLALATFSEIRANFPSWGTILISTIISLLVTWFITEIRPAGRGLGTNFTNGMQWTIFIGLIVVVILSIVYIFLTEEAEEK